MQNTLTRCVQGVQRLRRAASSLCPHFLGIGASGAAAWGFSGRLKGCGVDRYGLSLHAQQGEGGGQRLKLAK